MAKIKKDKAVKKITGKVQEYVQQGLIVKTIRLPEKYMEQMEVVVRRTGINFSELVRQAIYKTYFS